MPAKKKLTRDDVRIEPTPAMAVHLGIRVSFAEIAQCLSAEQSAAFFGGIAAIASATKGARDASDRQEKAAAFVSGASTVLDLSPDRRGQPGTTKPRRSTRDRRTARRERASEGS